MGDEKDKLLEECLRRFRMIAHSNSDDWRWYQSQCKQNLRALEPKILKQLNRSES